MLFSSHYHTSPRVAVIGGGSWGTTIARLVALNLLSRGGNAATPQEPRSPIPYLRYPQAPPPGLTKHENSFQRSVSPTIRSSNSRGLSTIPLVRLWVHDEIIRGENLTDIINTRHENIKYLPKIALPENVIATASLEEAVRDAHVLIFAVPHQFLTNVLQSLSLLQETNCTDTESVFIPRDTVAISLIKGLQVNRNETDSRNRLTLTPYSEVIQKTLGLDHVAVVMGANVAMDIAHDHFAETTLACQDLNVANYLATYLFRNDNFHIQITNDVSTVEYCGALKNIVALGAGFCDGMDLEVSTKAAVIRQGLEEMITFCDVFDRTGNFEVRSFKS